jgi:hypothetical protein
MRNNKSGNGIRQTPSKKNHYIQNCVTVVELLDCISGLWIYGRSGLDPDSMTLWIRMRIGHPDSGAHNEGKMYLLINFNLIFI